MKKSSLNLEDPRPADQAGLRGSSIFGQVGRVSCASEYVPSDRLFFTFLPASSFTSGIVHSAIQIGSKLYQSRPERERGCKTIAAPKPRSSIQMESGVLYSVAPGEAYWKRGVFEARVSQRSQQRTSQAGTYRGGHVVRVYLPGRMRLWNDRERKKLCERLPILDYAAELKAHNFLL